MTKRHGIHVLVSFVLMVLAGSLQAETFLLQDPPEETAQIGLRYMRPDLDSSLGLTTFSGVFDLRIDVPVSSSFNFLAQIPFSHFGIDHEWRWADDADDSSLGNIFLGLRYRQEPSATGMFNFDAGVFLPTAADDFGFPMLSYYTNFHEVQKFIIDYVTFYTNAAYHYMDDRTNGALFAVEIGPQLFMPTDNGDTEMWVHYGLESGMHFSRVAVMFELLGQFSATSDDNDFADRFVHQFVIGIHLIKTVVRPGLFYQIPLDDELKDGMDGSFGLKIEYSPR